MFQSVDCKVFEQHLWGMLHLNFGNRLSNKQVDRIRWHLFPEIRLDCHLDPFQENSYVSLLEKTQSTDEEAVKPKKDLELDEISEAETNMESFGDDLDAKRVQLLPNPERPSSKVEII